MKLLRVSLASLCAVAMVLAALPRPAGADPEPPLHIVKYFDDAAIPLGGTTTLTIDLVNTTTDFDFEDVSFGDTLPSGLGFLEDTASTTCDGELSVYAGGISIQGASLPAGESCSTFVTVIGFEAGAHDNTAFASPGGDTAFATLTVVAPPTVSKSFNPATVRNGGTTTLTLTLTNPNTTMALSDVGAGDVLPSGMHVASPNNKTTSCGGNVDLTLGIADLLELSGGSIAPGASCTVSVDVTVRGAGSITNNAAAFAFESGDPQGFPQRLGTGSGSVYVLIPPRLTKQFGASRIGLNGSTSLTFMLTNPNPSTALTGITFTDQLPGGLIYDDTASTSACGGTFEAHTNGLIITGATLAGGANCSFSVNVTGTTLGSKQNTTSRVSAAQTEDGDAATADLLVASPPSITKSFSAELVPQNGTVRMALDITNPNPLAITGVAVTDPLPTGLQIADPPNLINSCGGTVTASAGGSVVSLSGGSVAGAQCTVSVDLTPTTAGPLTNTTGNVSSGNAGTGNTGSDSIQVLLRPALAKHFSPPGIPLNGTSRLTFLPENDNPSNGLTGVAFVDNFPTGVVLASPVNLTNTCGGTATATPGSATVSLVGGALDPFSTCEVSVDVVGTAPGLHDNTSGPVSSNEAGTGDTAFASLAVFPPPVLSKSFGAATIPVNGSTTLSFTVSIPGPLQGTQSGVEFTDSLPSGLVVASPNGLSGSCNGGTIAAIAGSSTISLANGKVGGGNPPCSFSVSVRGVTAGQKNNTTGAVSSSTGGTGLTASASLVVASPPSLSKAFGDSSVPAGVPVSLTFSLSNPNSTTGLSGVGFSDSLPAGLVVASPNASTNTCGGTVTAVPGSGSVSLSGGTIGVSGGCSVRVDVVGTTAGQKLNTSGAVSATEGGSGNTASASVVVVAPPSIGKWFAPSVVAVNGTSTLTFTLSNPNVATTLNGVGFGDSLPAGLVVNTPSGLANGCGGTASAAESSVSLSNGSIPPLGTCTVSVSVKGVGAGTKNNVSGAVSSTNGGSGNTASAVLVVALPPSLTKAFGQASIAKTGSTSLTLTLSNPNAGTGLSGIAFTDPLPLGLKVASPSGLANTCGGIVQAVAGSTAVSVSGVSVPASALCTVKLDVRSTGSTGLKTNTTTAVTSNEAGLGSPATATITITG
jgi:uncharacterized repeat protein (TIGR01451 family)